MNSNNKILILFAFLVLAGSVKAQVTADDYARADTMYKFSNDVYNTVGETHWIPKTSLCWYTVKTHKGTEYRLADAEKAKITAAFDQVKLAEKLSENTNSEVKPYELNLSKVRLDYKKKTLTFEFSDNKWECSLKNYELKKAGEKEGPREWKHWASTEGNYDFEPVNSPDGSKIAFIKNDNVYVKDADGKNETQLSFDGAPGDFYLGDLKWSPDGKKLATVQIRKNELRYYYMVESSPKDQLQPILHKQEYLKPGDALPIARPRLFNMEILTQIEVDGSAFENQYDLGRLRWEEDSKGFTFEFNQRGHQVYQVVMVDAETGKYNIIVDEQPETFVDYNQKLYRHHVSNTKELIWASERDGWNHLYLIDKSTGMVINQITKGDWVMRNLLNVDEENRTIYFEGSGRNAGEDPYFIHYYSIGFDGNNLTELTPEAFNHNADFSKDNQYLVDTYSSVTEAPITVLRSAETGKVILELAKADISELLAKGWKKPEVFVTKARDNESDIWGNIYYPTNFDSTKTYPVIEYIYAGPHGSFAQKSFRPYIYYISGLKELGFIIVQLDGMGTSNRSKAFQDVCYKNLKDGGFPDRIKWITEAAKTRPFMDISRVGIYGGSAGGQSSTGAVLFHPEFYKVAVSSCGCHDNRMDKIWWNEQWMGYPIGKQYEESSNVCNAYRLKGDLMLIVGELDTNVDPASTMQVADALIKANKDFELVVLPGMDHTLGGNFGERKRRDFFVEKLYHQLSPITNQ